MKKIFTFFAAMLMTMSLSAASYGIAVNGTTYYAGEQNPSPGDPSFQEFMVLGLSVNAGDKLQLWDPSANGGKGAGWAVPLDGASTKNISLDGDHYVCNAAACYDFYIKLKYEADQLYVGEGACGSPQGTAISGQGGQGGGDTPGGGGSATGNPRYYYKGYVDGDDIEPSDETLFSHGIATITVLSDGYLMVLYQVDGQPGVQYMTQAYVDGPTHATLIQTDGGNKMHVGAGNHTLYLYDNGDGTLELSIEPIPGKTLADPQPERIENTVVTDKARKVFVDGQLRILCGDKMFDATGRQL